MKTLLISTVLVATSFAASAMNYGIDIRTHHTTDGTLTRADVIAEFHRANSAGEVALTEFEIRQADRRQLQSPSNVTREQLQQEIVALRDQGLLTIHGDR